MTRLFFGYAADDMNARESIQLCSSTLAEHASVEQSVTWEDLKVDGKIIIHDILDNIDNSTLSIFDITSLNNNVLFELGYAIGSGKPVVITKESDNKHADKLFREFSLLTTTGFTKYLDSGELTARLAELVADPPQPLLNELLGVSSNPVDEATLLYIPSMKEDEASRELSRTLETFSDLSLVRIDLDEHGTAPLAWLTQVIYAAPFAIYHMTPSEAYLSEVSNRRCSLLSGISQGLRRQVRIVINSTENVSLDYKDLRIAYRNTKEIAGRTTKWLSGLSYDSRRKKDRRVHLPAELAALRFGNPVAEADEQGLDEYFVETRDFLDVVEGTATIFTGRKGTGKTASMIQAANILDGDARNLVCKIKPASFELEALCELMSKIHTSHIGAFLIEGVWKYLLYTEVASSLVRQTEATPAGVVSGSAIDNLRIELEKSHGGVDVTFAARLEDLLANLNVNFDEVQEREGIESTRKEVSRALYSGYISHLRGLLADAVSDKNRVALLIDNLDKAWERGANLPAMSAVIFGLLSAVGRLADEFAREKRNTSQVMRFTLTAFLRSDIYSYVRQHAREPDKISSAEIEWRDSDLLARVLEDRFVASRNGRTEAGELWTSFFAERIHGMGSRSYILSRVQPRPRDIIFFANAAVVQASNSRHAVICEDDMDKAELRYSQFAYEALLVEGVAVGINMEELLMAFAGESPRLKLSEVEELISIANLPVDSDVNYILILRQHGFLGIKTAASAYDYRGSVGEMRRADKLASKLEKSSGQEREFEIHPAYRRHLAIDDI